MNQSLLEPGVGLSLPCFSCASLFRLLLFADVAVRMEASMLGMFGKQLKQLVRKVKKIIHCFLACTLKTMGCPRPRSKTRCPRLRLEHQCKARQQGRQLLRSTRTATKSSTTISAIINLRPSSTTPALQHL